MFETIIEMLNTPYLWQSLGLITAISLFISPILYNGDYKTASKSLVIVGGYMSFVALLEYFHLGIGEGCTCDIWIQPIMLLILVALSYIIGLFLGVYIHNKSNKKLLK